MTRTLRQRYPTASQVCSCTLATSILLLSPGESMAGEFGAGEFGGSLAATTDYVYRGISQTRGEPALQADLHYRPSSEWTVGVWTSTIDFNSGPGEGLEVDLYASREWPLNDDWNARVGLTHYLYSNDPRPLRYDYDELVGSLIYRSRFVATVAWSPNVSQFSNGYVTKREPATSYEVSASQPLSRRLSATVGAGYYDLPAVPSVDYWFWNAGLAWSMGPAQLAISYIDADRTALRAYGYSRAGGRWTGLLAWRF